MISPYTIHIAYDELSELKRKLSRTRWPDELQDSGWQYGPPLSFMNDLVHYWQTGFDWRRTEEELNGYPNFIFEKDDFKIHFLHIKGNGTRSVPLIMTHGWPGSVLEMMKVIPFLTNDPDFSFDLVIPSIIGFGFSSKPTKAGCNLHTIAGCWNALMQELGYQRYISHGGDFGAAISTALALKYPENLLGIHLNYIPGSYSPYLPAGETLTKEEIEYFAHADAWYKTEGAYGHQHRTKPLTLAYSLNDSPAGLCAWIIEKFATWSDCEGDPLKIFTKDELLSNVSLYWLTQTIHSSIRLYNENSKAPLTFTAEDFIGVPVGIAHFEKEDPFPPRKFIERGYNVQHWSYFPIGGHFAAMEQPEMLSADIRAFAQLVDSR